MKIISQLLFFFCQPILWIGLLRIILDSNQRIKMSRNEFRKAIFPGHFEVQHFVLNLIVSGIILSAFGILLGPIISFNWLIIYQGLLLINLLLFPKVILPITTLVVASLTEISLQSMHFPILSSQFKIFPHAVFANSMNYILIVSIVLIALGLMIDKDGGRFLVPKIFRNQRNVRTAGYPYQEFTIAPMLVLIPGGWIHHLMPFWPIFNMGIHSFTPIFIPMLLGLKITIFKNAPRQIIKKLSVRFLWLGVIGLFVTIAVFILSYFRLILIHNIPEWLLGAGLLILLFLTWWNLWIIKRYDTSHGDYYSEAVDGVRVIGIEPNTPAAKMNLSIGDTILDVNDQSVTDEEQFYEALLKQPTYCHLKVRNHDGELKLTGSAIYNNSPHEIGIILFKKSSLN